jgi:hypothetical protein
MPPFIAPGARRRLVADSSGAEAETIIIRVVAPAGRAAGVSVSLPLRISRQALRIGGEWSTTYDRYP